MTRLSTSLPVPTKPTTVRLGELAIAAGMAGFPVTLCYRDFPAPVLAKVWTRHLRSVGSDAVHHIRTQRDLNRLPGRMVETRVVFVHTPRLHVPAAWSIQLADSEGVQRSPRPAMFSRFLPADVDEDPGATLVIRGTVPENNGLFRWLVSRRDCDVNQCPFTRMRFTL